MIMVGSGYRCVTCFSLRVGHEWIVWSETEWFFSDAVKSGCLCVTCFSSLAAFLCIRVDMSGLLHVKSCLLASGGSSAQKQAVNLTKQLQKLFRPKL
ncbi:hypothetical protein AVEN_212509-1 [Araneus ventricosus]|uniref:Uncharacterized protein n=1 Tax=Araneus ventricosus TaxID=182803 RepID=A0A4Y2KBB5_ARAVE|nr:hypothetical protein AVEN_212509-1 [Araneus ventricosus]